jgi:hypothetical protein
MAKGLDRSNIGRIMGWREEAELLHRGQKLIADELRSIQRTGMHSLEAHRADFGEVRQRLSRPSYLAETLADSGRIIRALAAWLANPFNPALGQDSFARHLQNPELEGGATDIWHQTLHGAFHLILRLILTDLD